MKEANSLSALLVRLWQHLSRRRKRQFVLLLGLMLVSALAEVVSLGAVLPFLGILVAPEQVFNYPHVKEMVLVLGITSPAQLVLPLTVAFAVAALSAGAIRLLFLWANIRLSNASAADLSIKVYHRTLYQPLQVHTARNSSVVISGINKVRLAQTALQSVMTLASSAVLVASIMLALLAINTEVAAAAFIGFGSIYALIAWRSHQKLKRNSQCLARESTQAIKSLQEGLGGIRDILLDGTQPLYCNIYQKTQQALMRAHGNTQFLGASPRHVIEALGMVLIAVLAYGLNSQVEGAASALPVLGALAFGAQRTLPALQQSYSAWANIASSGASLGNVLDLLDQPLPAEANQPVPAPLSFQKGICFDAVSFRYSDDGAWILNGISLTIPKGARIGFVGSTGSGKSTMLDLLMGLLTSNQGRILVDGLPISGERRHSWQQAIAHVPQNIYLADATLAENIAFGVPRDAIDMDRVRQAARQAQIAGFIENRTESYRELIGEHGIRLSGGQRQRIGIARALYKQASVLVFDEATSALDNTTERAVMDAIEGLNRDLTILLVAHRLTTVKRCGTIIELAHGRVVAQGTYEQLLEHSSSFRGMAGAAV